MKNPLACEGCTGVGLLLARVPLGTVLALAGYQKFTQGGVGEFVQRHMSTAEQFMSPQMAGIYLHAVPYAEVVLGALLVAGLLTRVSGLLAAAMLFSFGLAMGGASGFFTYPPERAPELFRAPFTYGVLALVAFFAGPGRISLDGLLFGRRPAPRPRDYRA